MPRGHFGKDSSDEWPSEREGNPTVRFIFQRSWVLIVPLIAIAWYNSRTIQPLAKKMDETTLQEKATAEGKRDEILTNATRLEARISMLAALDDTFKSRFTKIDSLIDSVSTVRASDTKDLNFLQSRADSLRKIMAGADSQSAELSAKLPPMQTKIDSLNRLIADWNTEIKRLEDARAADSSLTDRVLRPNVYRKNTALMTGAGDFPNRDALPKR